MVLPIIMGVMAAAQLAKMGYDMYSQNKTANETKSAQGESLKRMKEAGGVYERYRPMMAGARRKAYEGQMGAYQGANNALTTMYGAANAQPTATKPVMGGHQRPPGVEFGQTSPDEAARGKAILEANNGELASLAGPEFYPGFVDPSAPAFANPADAALAAAQAKQARMDTQTSSRNQANALQRASVSARPRML